MRACSGVTIPPWWTPWNGSVAPVPEVAAPAVRRPGTGGGDDRVRWPGRSRPASGAATWRPGGGRSRRGPRRPVGGEPGGRGGPGWRRWRRAGGTGRAGRRGTPRCPGVVRGGPSAATSASRAGEVGGDGRGRRRGPPAAPAARRHPSPGPRRRRWRPRRPVRDGKCAPGSTAARRPPPSRAGRPPPTRWPRDRVADGTGGTGRPAPGRQRGHVGGRRPAGPQVPLHGVQSAERLDRAATSVSSSSRVEALTELPALEVPEGVVVGLGVELVGRGPPPRHPGPRRPAGPPTDVTKAAVASWTWTANSRVAASAASVVGWPGRPTGRAVAGGDPGLGPGRRTWRSVVRRGRRRWRRRRWQGHQWRRPPVGRCGRRGWRLLGVMGSSSAPGGPRP